MNELLAVIVAALISGLGPDMLALLMVCWWLGGVIAGGIVQGWLGYNLEGGLGENLFLGITFVLGTILVCVPAVFNNWETVTLPLLSSATLCWVLFPLCFRCFVFTGGEDSDTPILGMSKKEIANDENIAFSNRHCKDEMTSGSIYNFLPGSMDSQTGETTVVAIWAVLSVIGIIIAKVTERSKEAVRQIDLDDPNGKQNSLIARLINDEEVTRDDFFESKFPVLSTMAEKAQNDKEFQKARANGGDGLDPIRKVVNEKSTRSQTGGMLERAQRDGEQLTADQLRILEICKTDDQERDRLLFGGGLW